MQILVYICVYMYVYMYICKQLRCVYSIIFSRETKGGLLGDEKEHNTGKKGHESSENTKLFFPASFFMMDMSIKVIDNEGLKP